ncbi:MAG TPA: DUF4412 domain-containing protein [Opitutaceae bacterium]|nr:DUF4412 domain-containing protein [Opitutaceae bacterium]
MKTLLSLVLSLTIAASFLHGADTFEGKIKMTITTQKGKKSETMPMSYAIKDSKMRIDMENPEKGGGTLSTIVDMKAQEATVLMPEQKMYMTHSFKDSDLTQKAAEAAELTSVEKTNETTTIAGYKATKYLIKTKDQKEPVEVWATEGLGHYVSANAFGPGAGKNKSSGWEKALYEKGFFPLRTVVTEKRGTTTTMEVVNVEKTSLPDSLFKAPADYQKFAMPSLKGLIPGFGGKN